MKKLLTIATIFLGLFLFVGITSASDVETLQPASTITYNEDLTVNGTGRFNSVYIGAEGVGGVTFFNGTIINIGETVPVTFGDDVRIDGMIWGGPNKGNVSDQALKIADTLLPGLTNVNDLGSGSLKWKDLYLAGTLDAANINYSSLLSGKDLKLTGKLDGVSAKFTGSVEVGNLLGSGVVNSDNILNSSIQGKDIKDQTIQGNHINTDADLNISQLYSTDGIITNGNITVTGDVDGVKVSQENAVWFHDSSSIFTGPSEANKPSKIITGVTTMPICTAANNPVENLVTFPTSYTNMWTYSVNLTEWWNGSLTNGVFEHVYATNNSANSVYIRGVCRGAGFSTNVSFIAVGY